MKLVVQNHWALLAEAPSILCAQLLAVQAINLVNWFACWKQNH